MNYIKSLIKFVKTNFVFVVYPEMVDRGEKLSKKLNKVLDNWPGETNLEKIERGLKLLKDKDFILFYSRQDENLFIQYCADDKYITFDYPFSIKDKRSKLLHRLEYILAQLKFRYPPSFWRNPPYYEILPDKYGNTLQAKCGKNIKLAAKLGMKVFTEVYRYPENFNLEIKISSWKNDWF